MLSPDVVYPAVVTWLAALGRPVPPAARQAVARLVAAVLVAQSLHPADLQRVLSGPRRSPPASASSAWPAPWTGPG